MKRVKQIVMMAFASLLAQCVWAAVQVGDTVTWSNTGTSYETASTASDPIGECNINIKLTAQEGLPEGSIVRIKKVRLASVNTSFVDWNSNSYNADASLIKINGVVSKGGNGYTVNNNTPAGFLTDGAEGQKIASTATSQDYAMNYEFANNVDLVVGQTYVGDSGNTANSALALCYRNGNLCYGSNHDRATVRYIVSNDSNSVLQNPNTVSEGKYPIYEITATVVSFPDYSGLPAVEFETPNAPTTARGSNVTANTAYGNDSDFLQYNAGTSLTAVKVTGSTGTPNIFGGFNTGNAGGAVNCDTWMNIVGGTFGIVCGGSYCNWNGAEKVHNSGNVVIEMSAGTANYILGGNHQEGGGSAAPKWSGNTTVVVKGDAVVKGAIIGAGTVAHSRSQTYTGNTKVVVKNVQSDNTAGQMDGATTDYSDYIVGGGAYASNTNSKLGITGNTAVEIDIAEGKSGDFVKNIVGGGLITEGGSYHNDGVHSKVTGNSSVTISAPSTVKFKGAIVAGGYKVNNCAGDATVSGTATLTLNGGDFSEATIKAGTATGNKILNVNMDMTLDASTVAGFTHVNIGAGKKLTVNVTEATTLTTIFGGEGALIKAGEGTLTLNADNTLTGGIEVSAGTLKTGSAKKGFGPYDGTSATASMSVIKVAEGAVLDVANIAGSNYGYCYKVELAGELTNSGAAMGTTSRQLAEIKVTGDNAKITGANEYCLLNSSYDPTKLDLNGHTLEVAMTEGKAFRLRTTSITGTGTINITSGQLHITTDTSLAAGADVTVNIKPGATFDDGLDIFSIEKIHSTVESHKIVRDNKTYSCAIKTFSVAIPEITGAVAKVGDVAVSGSVMADYGTTVTIVYEPTTGYQIGETATVVVANVTADVTDVDVSSIVVTKIQVTITIPEIANTTVTVTGGELVGNTVTVDYGTEITVTYTPITNYVGGGQVAITAESDKTIETTGVTMPSTRTAGDIYAKTDGTYVLADGTVVTPIDGDVVVFSNTWTSPWGGGPNISSYPKVKLARHMDVGKTGGIAENQQVEVAYASGNDSGVYLHGHIGAGATITGNGNLFVGHTVNTVTIGDGVSIACNFGIQSNQPGDNHDGYVALINGTVTVTGTIYIHTGCFKLAEGAKLVTTKLDADTEAKIVSGVEHKHVVYTDNAYQLVMDQVTITVPEIANTTVAVTGGTLADNAVVVDYGTAVTVTYTANENYKLVGGDGVYTFDGTADGTVGEGLTAELDVVTITIPEAPANTTVSVTVNGNPVTVENNTITVTIGAAVVVTYTADEGYEPETTTTEFTAAAGTQPTINVPTNVKPIRPTAPVATVTTLVKEGLDAAYTFTMDANEPADTSEYYGDWDADFVVTFDKDVAVGSLKLSGQYDGNGPDWADLTIDDVTAGTEIKLISMVAAQLGYEGLTVPYSMIRDSVKVFNCGVKNLDGNAGTKMTVKLVLSKDGETLVIGEPVVYTLVGMIVIPEEPTITEGELVVPTPEGTETIEIDGAVVESAKVPLDQTTVYTVTAKNANGEVIAESQIGVVVTTTKTGTEENKPTVAVAVPFTGATVANLLDTTNFAEGDQLKAFINGAYATWTFKTGKWTSGTTFSAEGSRSAPNADTTPLARGSAVWVTTAADVVAFGSYDSTAVEPEVTTGYNLIGNPMMTAIKPAAKTVGDVLIPVGSTELVRYKVIEKAGGAKVWQCTKSVQVSIPGLGIFGSQEQTSEEDPTVKVGGSVWLITK